MVLCGYGHTELHGHTPMFEFGDLETLRDAVTARDFQAFLDYDEATEASIAFLKKLEARPNTLRKMWRYLDLLIADGAWPYQHWRFWNMMVKRIDKDNPL
jgi:hypothetical protein